MAAVSLARRTTRGVVARRTVAVLLPAGTAMCWRLRLSSSGERDVLVTPVLVLVELVLTVLRLGRAQVGMRMEKSKGWEAEMVYVRVWPKG